MSGGRRTGGPPTPLPVGMPALVLALAERLQTFPGIGEKAAKRHATWLAQQDPAVARGIASVMGLVASNIAPCARCGALAERDAEGVAVCTICKDNKRTADMLCIVGYQQDMFAIERSAAWRGRYFVLGAMLSPLDGIGIEELPMDKLYEALVGVKQLLLALPMSVDGDATALFLGRDIAAEYKEIRITRIAQGVAYGAPLEFADQMTLAAAVVGAKDVS